MSKSEIMYLRGEIMSMDKNELYERLIGTNVFYYMDKFEYMELYDTKTSWNWAAFFFGPFWMVYRKMYLNTAIILTIMVVLNMIMDIIFGKNKKITFDYFIYN